MFLFTLDNTVVADVQPKTIGSLGPIDKLPWISVSFGLGAVSVNLVWRDTRVAYFPAGSPHIGRGKLYG